jgi:CcmD family protein
MPNGGYITLAYVVTWVVLIGYVVRLIRLTRRAAGHWPASADNERTSSRVSS